MILTKLKDCSKCKHSISYGSKDSPTVKCNSENYDVRRQFEINGKHYASRCASYEEKGSVRDGFILDNYMDVILGGNSDFVLHSTKTNQDFEYRLKRVDSIIEGIDYLYYLNVKYGILDVYAGSIYYDNKEQEFKFSQGDNGKVDETDLSVRSLLFVLNKLVDKREVQYLELLHTGKCSVCGEDLIDEDDLRTGVHSKCRDNLDYPEIIKEF